VKGETIMRLLKERPVALQRNLKLEEPPNRWQLFVTWLLESLTPVVPVVSTFGVGSLKFPASVWRGVVFIAFIVVMMAMGRDAFALNKSAAMQSQLATLEMPFIENQGQTDDSVKFYAKTFGGTVFVTENGELIYTLPKSKAKQRQVGLPEVTSGLVLKEHLLNARHG
jgi:hypothetical protein